MAVRTFATLITEARTILQDQIGSSGGAFRYTDVEMFEAINGALAETRAKRPDLFLSMGLRMPLPFYAAATDMNVAFPLDASAYTPFVYYLAGRAEIREDTFGNDARATTLLNKYLTMIMTATA